MALRRPNLYYNLRGNKLVTGPALEPVSLTELKTHLRIPTATEDEDLYLGQTILDAVRWIEDDLNIAMINQTWKLTLDKWPGYHEPWWDGVREMPISELYSGDRAKDIVLPRFPLVSVSSVTVYDEESNSTAVTIANVFDIDINSTRGRMKLKRGATWPIATRSLNAIEINYVAGYGTAAEDVPPSLRRGVLEMAAYLYTHRGDCTPEGAYKMSGSEGIVRSFKIRQL